VLYSIQTSLVLAQLNDAVSLLRNCCTRVISREVMIDRKEAAEGCGEQEKDD
jgi:hypothetical protein